jgi:hypothetical protein
MLNMPKSTPHPPIGATHPLYDNSLFDIYDVHPSIVNVPPTITTSR